MSLAFGSPTVAATRHGHSHTAKKKHRTAPYYLSRLAHWQSSTRSKGEMFLPEGSEQHDGTTQQSLQAYRTWDGKPTANGTGYLNPLFLCLPAGLGVQPRPLLPICVLFFFLAVKEKGGNAAHLCFFCVRAHVPSSLFFLLPLTADVFC